MDSIDLILVSESTQISLDMAIAMAKFSLFNIICLVILSFVSSASGQCDSNHSKFTKI